MNTKRRCVAILDDDQSVAKAIARLLNASQIAAKSFATGVQLLTFLETRHPDCLVLDLQMPGMDGMDVMHHIRQRGIHLPIVVITAHEEIGSRENCLDAGANAYLRKPVDVTELIAAINNAVAFATERGKPNGGANMA